MKSYWKSIGLSWRCCIVSDIVDALQVWYQKDLVPVRKNILEETKAIENRGQANWQWHVRGAEHLISYLSQLMEVGNPIGMRLRKKLEGNPRTAAFETDWVSSPACRCQWKSDQSLAL